jgi:hypothetical protein
MPAQRCAPAYRAPYSKDVLVRQSVFFAGVCRPSGRPPTMIFGQISWNRQDISSPTSSYTAEQLG